MNEKHKGVVVDREGFFIGAFTWSASEPAPNFKTNETGLRLLTEPEALSIESPAGRWDAKGKKWHYPTERHWVVARRQDKPGIGELLGSRLVWPKRLPALPEGQVWVAVEPPEHRAQMPLWAFEAQEWRFPIRRAIADADGLIVNTVCVADENDLVLEEGQTALDPSAFEPVDELGTPCAGLSKGDRVDLGAGTAVARRPTYTKFPLRIVRQALQRRDLLPSVVTFLRERGYEIEDVDRLGGVGLGTKWFREWLEKEGYTLAQAQRVLIRDFTLTEQEEQMQRELEQL